MSELQIVVLAIVQGITEFLPISSSGHLILAPYLFGFDDQGLAFDVAVHLGSLIAVLAYFRTEVLSIARAWLASTFAARPGDADSRLGWAILIGTLPVVVAGVLLKTVVETEFRAPWVIASATIGFGLLLWVVDYRARRERTLDRLGLRDALLIGLAQVLALIPGTSRSGITITAGLALGLDRASSSRFSFLLSIPTILASSLLVAADLVRQAEPVDWGGLIAAVALAGLAAYSAIHLFLRFVERIGMWPFVMYRLVLGLVILVLAY